MVLKMICAFAAMAVVTQWYGAIYVHSDFTLLADPIQAIVGWSHGTI
jgi:hypothetical protein